MGLTIWPSLGIDKDLPLTAPPPSPGNKIGHIQGHAPCSPAHQGWEDRDWALGRALRRPWKSRYLLPAAAKRHACVVVRGHAMSAEVPARSQCNHPREKPIAKLPEV